MGITSDELTKIADRHWQSLLEANSGTSFHVQNETEIKSILALSDFVATSVIRTPDLLESILTLQNQPVASDDFEGFLKAALQGVETEQQLHVCLRQFRRLHMANIAWTDLLNRQSIETSLHRVSALADALIKHCNLWLHSHLCQKYGCPEGEHGPQPLLIFGMGKLGGRELNFSSDIDLIFGYPSPGVTSGGSKSIEHQQFFTKLAQKIIAALHQITVDGQVFRVDMRLRPFGDSGPLVSHFSAIEDYYQDQGREWERYAMIKARILNEDCAYSSELKQILKPFVFRRYLDYGAIESLRNMKRLISQEVRRRGLKDNIKLGAGGIREVEFIVQSFQLIRGGREPELQQPGLLTSICALKDLAVMPNEDLDQLRQSYLFLRKVEHCLQQFDDQQTQLLPMETLNQQRLIQVLEYKDYPAFLEALSGHMQFIHRQFTDLIGDSVEDQTEKEAVIASEFNDLWQLDLTYPEAEKLFTHGLAKDKTEHFFALLNEFKHNLNKRGVGQKGQDTLQSLMPVILSNLAKNDRIEHSTLLERVLSVLSAISGRTTYFQLLNENHGATNQLIKLCAASPWISQQLSRFPILLDELLNPAQLYNPTPYHEYSEELRPLMLRIDPDDLELQMEVLRQYKLSQQLKIAAADITNALSIMKVSDHLSYLAEAIIEEVLNLAWQQITEKHGCPSGKSSENMGFAVLGYGKLGGIELGYGSDLDLVFVHNADHQSVTDGEKSIEAGRFYTKLAQRIMHLFSTKTASGALYELDMRLRPSGNAGLLVCHISGYSDYQLSQAWTWEHQALVRARFIAGDKALSVKFKHVRQAVLQAPRKALELARNVVEMREKMRTHLSKGNDQCFDLKQDPGGIADIEFLVQFWVLAYSNETPELTKWSDNVRILEQLSSFKLITKAQADVLIQAYLEFRNTTHRLALQKTSVLEDKALFSESRKAVTSVWHDCLLMKSE